MYSQLDPRWRDVRLGTSRRTIGQDGCLLCCAAEVLKRHGWTLDPASLNRELVQHTGFVAGNRFVFDALDRYGLRLVAVRDWRKVAADVEEIRDWIRRDLDVILAVNVTPWSRYNEHWVLVRGSAHNDLWIEDPLLPPSAQQPTLLLPRYARPDWDLARAIYRAVAYEWEVR